MARADSKYNQGQADAPSIRDGGGQPDPNITAENIKS